MKLLANASKSKIKSKSADELLVQTIAQIDCIALGVAIGALSGLAIFIATIFLLIKGGERIGPTFALLNQYFLGYSVSYMGSFVGILYGFIGGYFLGWSIAFLRNFVIKIYLYFIKFKGRIAAAGNFLDS